MAKEEKGEMLPLEAKDKASEEGQNEDKVELKPKMTCLVSRKLRTKKKPATRIESGMSTRRSVNTSRT